MSESFEKLKQIGTAKIHKETHISLRHLDAIINEDFSSITKVQFLGFVSILEREYHLNLSDYKERSLELFVDNSPYNSSESHLFVVAKRQKNYTPLYIFITFLIFASVAYISIDLTPTPKKIFVEENSVIKEAKKIVEKKIQKREVKLQQPVEKSIEKIQQEVELETVDKEAVKDDTKIINVTDEDSKKIALKDNQVLHILAKSKVWLGYINLKNNQKKSLIIKSSFDLPLKGDFLLMFGHGRVSLELDGQEYHFTTAQTLRLLYKDKRLTKISVKEFKALNKGKKW